MKKKEIKLSDVKVDKKYQLNIHDREAKPLSIDEGDNQNFDNLVVRDSHNACEK